MATTAASKKQLTEEARLENGLGRVEANALKLHADGPSGLSVDNQTLAQKAVGPSTPTMTKRDDG
jgi:hypothetical protein